MLLTTNICSVFQFSSGETFTWSSCAKSLPALRLSRQRWITNERQLIYQTIEMFLHCFAIYCNQIKVTSQHLTAAIFTLVLLWSIRLLTVYYTPASCNYHLRQQGPLLLPQVVITFSFFKVLKKDLGLYEADPDHLQMLFELLEKVSVECENTFSTCEHLWSTLSSGWSLIGWIEVLNKRFDSKMVQLCLKLGVI